MAAGESRLTIGTGHRRHNRVAYARRNREQRAARVEEVLVEEVARRQARLDRDELAAGITLEGEEEESGVDLADPVDAEEGGDDDDDQGRLEPLSQTQTA